MKFMHLIVLCIAFVLSFTPLCSADEIGERVRHAHEQIERGVRSGDLSNEEAHRLKDELNDVKNNEDRLVKELDRLEKHISKLKSYDNRKGYGGRGDNRHEKWIKCANENELCKFRGQKRVRYGEDNRWNYKTADNGIFCNNRVFGDPAHDVKKACYVED